MAFKSMKPAKPKMDPDGDFMPVKGKTPPGFKKDGDGDLMKKGAKPFNDPKTPGDKKVPTAKSGTAGRVVASKSMGAKPFPFGKK